MHTNMHMHTHTHTHMHACLHARMHACTHTHAHTQAHTRILSHYLRMSHQHILTRDSNIVQFQKPIIIGTEAELVSNVTNSDTWHSR